MGFSYLDHEADVGILAEGGTIEEAFCEGAKAAFNVMADIDEIKPKKKVEVRCESDSIPSLFVAWLNELLSLADMEGMLFSEFKLDKIKKREGKLLIVGEARGEEIDPKRHKLKTEVKAATYSGLKYEEIKGRHVLRCVLDL